MQDSPKVWIFITIGDELEGIQFLLSLINLLWLAHMVLTLAASLLLAGE